MLAGSLNKSLLHVTLAGSWVVLAGMLGSATFLQQNKRFLTWQPGAFKNVKVEAAKTSKHMLKLAARLSCLIPLGLPPGKGRGQSSRMACFSWAIMSSTLLAGSRRRMWPPSLPSASNGLPFPRGILSFFHSRGPLILSLCNPSVACHHIGYLLGLESEPQTGNVQGEPGGRVNPRQTGQMAAVVTAFPPRGLEEWQKLLPQSPCQKAICNGPNIAYEVSSWQREEAKDWG